MKILTTAFSIIFFIQSCQTNNKQFTALQTALKDCDQVAIVYYNNNDTLIYKANDTSLIKILTELISTDNEIINDSCKPCGRLIYNSKKREIFEVEFSTRESNESLNCNYVTYSVSPDIYKHRLTYRAGMLIDEVLYKRLRWSSTINDSLNIFIDSNKSYKIMDLPNNGQ